MLKKALSISLPSENPIHRKPGFREELYSEACGLLELQAPLRGGVVTYNAQ